MNERSSSAKTGAWIALLTIGSAAGTLLLACATPFAAFGALAALHMKRAEAVALIVAVWLTNQVIGFAFLHFPLTPNCFAWGGGLLLAALAGWAGAAYAGTRTRALSSGLTVGLALAAALAAYEATVFLEGWVLGGTAASFTGHVLFMIAWTNVVALLVLMLLHRLAMLGGLVTPGIGTARIRTA